jgi:hypothetical protein
MNDPAKSGNEVVKIHTLINDANRHITNGLKNILI